MPRPFMEVVAMIPAELLCRPAQIRIPEAVAEREYDVVCIGSPTWWLKGKPFAAAVCCRRYWKHNLKTVHRLGTKQAASGSCLSFAACEMPATGLSARGGSRRWRGGGCGDDARSADGHSAASDVGADGGQRGGYP
jgi:hypothetical protein